MTSSSCTAALLVTAGWLLAAGCSKGITSPATDAAASATLVSPAPPVFIEDDYSRAREEALRRGVPLVAVTRSPWCEGCTALQRFVFSDEALSCTSTRFVWLSLDLDQAQNAQFFGRFPIEDAPTLWVIDPDRQRAVLRYEGLLTTRDLQELLEDVEVLARPTPEAVAVAVAAASGSSSAPLPQCPGAAPTTSDSAAASVAPPASSSSAPPSLPPPPDPILEAKQIALQQWQDGMQQEVSGSFTGATRAYLAALQSPHAWSRRARVVDDAMRVLARSEPQRCLDLAKQELPALPRGTFATRAAHRALLCARIQGLQGTQEARNAATTLETFVRSPGTPILPAHRSELFEALAHFYKQDNEPQKSRKILREWMGFLSTELALARKSEQRRTLDAPLLRAHIQYGNPILTLPTLERSRREQEEDPVNQMNLSVYWFSIQGYDNALSLLDQNLSAFKGQGRLRGLLLKADILERTARKEEAIFLLEEASKEFQQAPLTHGHKKLLRELREKLSLLHRQKP